MRNGCTQQSKKPVPEQNASFALALVVLITSGAVALGHQLLWARRMIDLLGATTESSARVFGCFFLGLALGAAFISRLISRVRRPWRAIAAVELGVAILTVPILQLPNWTDWIWPALGFSRLIEWQGGLVKLMLSVMIVVPPAFLMGMTLPLALSAAHSTSNAENRHGVPLYAGNTLGGALGLSLAIGFLLPAAGVFSAMLTLMGINLVLACICFLKDKIENRFLPQSNSVSHDSRTRLNHGVIDSETIPGSAEGFTCLLAMFSGAAVLGVEVMAVEMIHLKLPLSFYPAASILTCVILVLGLAASLVPFLIRRFQAPRRIIPACLAAAGIAVVLAPVVFMNLSLDDSIDRFGDPLLGFVMTLCIATLVSIGPPMLFAGMIFPLCLVSCERLDPRLRIERIAQLLALNGVGGFLGAECAYRVLLPVFGVHSGIGVVGICYGIACLMTLRTSKGPTACFEPRTEVETLNSFHDSVTPHEPQLHC